MMNYDYKAASASSAKSSGAWRVSFFGVGDVYDCVLMENSDCENL